MQVIADDAIFACEALVQPRLPEGVSLRRLPGREIADADLSECVALLTRTVTKVDAALLERAPELRVVASASAGFDHVDRSALEARDVHFANAPGCNALAVAQWVSAAWTELLARPEHAQRRGARVGIVGHGEVGRRAAACLRALGHEVLVCDPPKARAGECPEHRSLDELLERCDALSLHVPLSREGEDSTLGLVSARRAEAFLARGRALINTSRGEVLEQPGFIPDGSMMILDVWPDEPDLPWTWLASAVATERLWVSPHIAGYSAEAKLRGASMAVDAVAEHMGWGGEAPSVNLPAPHSRSPRALFELSARGEDHDRLVAAAAGPDPAGAFTALRRGYAHRREFAAYRRHFAADGPLAAFSKLLDVE